MLSLANIYQLSYYMKLQTISILRILNDKKQMQGKFTCGLLQNFIIHSTYTFFSNQLNE